MLKNLLLALLLFVGLADLACQSYTKGIEQSMARADETAVIAALHTIALAQKTYSVSNDGNYGSFQQLTEGGYLDARFNADRPVLKDYVLTMTLTPKSGSAGNGSYVVNADPKGSGPQAGRYFYLDSTSEIIHVNPAQRAAPSDPVVQ